MYLLSFKKVVAIFTTAVLLSSSLILVGCGKKYYSDDFNDIRWPDSILAQNLPEPESKKGKIETDRENLLEVYIGDTSLEQYESYVSSCKGKGFTEEYDQGTTYDKKPYYKAKNTDGYSLELEYHEDDSVKSYKPMKKTMTIELRYSGTNTEVEVTTPLSTKKTTEKATEIVTEKPVESSQSSQSSESSKSDSGTVSASFKETMDSYEAFFDEYVEFMKKYNENPSDLTLLAEYAEYMSKYVDYIGKLNDIDEDELSAADLLYYTEVNARILSKLSEIE